LARFSKCVPINIALKLETIKHRNMSTRKPYVAGKFYPGNKDELHDLISSLQMKVQTKVDLSLSKEEIIGGVVPHAGYSFSACQAIHFFEIIKNSGVEYDTVFIINPNHTGYGSDLSLDSNDSWETPLGTVDIDKDFMNLLNIPQSEIAHKYEHSGEVMLPLLQYFLNYEFKILPVTITRQNVENGKILAEEIRQANTKLNKKILIIASSDFSHFVKPSEGKRLDKMVLDEINALDSEQLYKKVTQNNISVCGYGPIISLIEYSMLVTTKPQSRILCMGNSGDVIPSDEVVDYISILFYN